MHAHATPQPQEEDQRLGRVLDFADQLLASMRTIHREVMESEATPEQKFAVVKDMVAATDQVARTVRRTLVLRDHLAHRRRARIEHRAAARRRLVRHVENTIRAEQPDRAEALELELIDRLDSPEIEADLATENIEDVIVQIETDLGLTWRARKSKRRTPADIVELHALASRTTRTATRWPHHDPPNH